MTPENKQIMQLLRAHITGSGTVTLPEANFGEVIKTADRQNILSMISDRLTEILADTAKSRDIGLILIYQIRARKNLMRIKSKRSRNICSARRFTAKETETTG